MRRFIMVLGIFVLGVSVGFGIGRHNGYGSAAGHWEPMLEAANEQNEHLSQEKQRNGEVLVNMLRQERANLQAVASFNHKAEADR
jgi:hypothetical protein